MPDLNRLREVFERARVLLAQPDNDFTWSSWIDAESALAEVDAIVARLRSGTLPTVIGVLFAPTGPMQEVSLSSGWGDEFVELANQFDAAITAEGPSESETCSCLDTSGLGLETVEELGFDHHYAEVSLLCCPRCGRNWLRYFYEIEAIARSGRWYLGVVAPEQRAGLVAANAKSTLEMLDWYRYGGSYYDGRSGRVSGPINL